MSVRHGWLTLGAWLACLLLAQGTVPAPPACSTLTIDGASVCNTAVVATHDQIHAGESRCISANGTPAYTCNFGSINKALTAYSYGMTTFLIPDVDCTAAQNCSVNIDNKGPISLRATDGTTAFHPIHGHGYWFFYDANGVFRLVG